MEAAAAFVKGHASIRTVVVERIDRLRPIQQLTLKVGATDSSPERLMSRQQWRRASGPRYGVIYTYVSQI